MKKDNKQYHIIRDKNECMWVGKLNINDPNLAARLPFRWKVNNKRATRNEIRCEWLAIRSNYQQSNIDDNFDRASLLYVNSSESDKI